MAAAGGFSQKQSHLTKDYQNTSVKNVSAFLLYRKYSSRPLLFIVRKWLIFFSSTPEKKHILHLLFYSPYILPFSHNSPPKRLGHKQRNVFSVSPFWQVPLFKQGAESQAFFREKDKWWWRHCKVLLYYSIPLKEKVDNYSAAVIIYHGGGGGGGRTILVVSP